MLSQMRQNKILDCQFLKLILNANFLILGPTLALAFYKTPSYKKNNCVYFTNNSQLEIGFSQAIDQ